MGALHWLLWPLACPLHSLSSFSLPDTSRCSRPISFLLCRSLESLIPFSGEWWCLKTRIWALSMLILTNVWRLPGPSVDRLKGEKHTHTSEFIWESCRPTDIFRNLWVHIHSFNSNPIPHDVFFGCLSPGLYLSSVTVRNSAPVTSVSLPCSQSPAPLGPAFHTQADCRPRGDLPYGF